MTNWDQIIEEIMWRECGGDPKTTDGQVSDSGGFTRYGISQNSGESREFIKSLDYESAKSWYTDNIYSKIKHIEKVNPNLLHILADMIINMGQRQAIRVCQTALNQHHAAGLDVDGFFGPNTNKWMSKLTAGQARIHRFDYYQDLIRRNPEKFARYEKGWNRRILEV